MLNYVGCITVPSICELVFFLFFLKHFYYLSRIFVARWQTRSFQR